MTGLSFVLLLVIVAIPIFMIVYNAFSMRVSLISASSYQ